MIIYYIFAKYCGNFSEIMGYSRGENKEFEALFRSMYPKVKAFAQGILQSEDDAEDIAQDVFVKLLNYPQAWENPETRNSYILMAVGTCSGHFAVSAVRLGCERRLPD